MNHHVPVKLIHPDAIVPTRSTPNAAGLDLYATVPVCVIPRLVAKIHTGVKLALPAGNVGMIWDRSGLGSRGLRVLAGVIDSDYRGEIIVCVTTLTDQVITIEAKDRVAQMLVVPITPCFLSAEFPWPQSNTERGDRGFGSTGA